MKNRRVIIIGGGHAGCEAALAAARLGCDAAMYAISLESVAMMPCNPCVGGSAKGHLVREIDALGGQMGKNTDASFIQSRMLNEGKGPAVYSLRAQADKRRYHETMMRTLESEKNLRLRQSEIIEIIVNGGRVSGVRSESGAIIECEAVVVCSGTYMEARCLYGETVTGTGPNGLRASKGLSENLRALGFGLMRFKTGTPARLSKRSLDFSKMSEQRGDEIIVPFSFETEPETIARTQIPCHLTYTNAKTHELIRSQIHRSPLFGGMIEGTGTRYCPSIEDKVVRFADKERHQVFIEPEGEFSDEMYAQGLSSSLPEDVQIAAYRTVAGLENCEFVRNAYAIEYDCVDATHLKKSLESKKIGGLFFAGQVCGSSGYEEAAAQGLIAGINAACMLNDKPPYVPDRADAYIGVLIDDLVTKGSREPYRMMTSRAEYRLLLRQDNADLRLTETGYEIGLISRRRYENFLQKKELIEREVKRVNKINVPPSDIANGLLDSFGSTRLNTGFNLAELMRRPELSYEKLKPVDGARPTKPDGCPSYMWDAVLEQVNIQIKYEGYIKLQTTQAEAFRKTENKSLPPDLDYESMKGLRIEARQKLSERRPESVGQASRITGVSPADIQVLLVYLKALSRK